jgi:signal transduction histidine kinase
VFFLFLGAYTLYQVETIKKQSFATLESITKTVNAILVEYTSAYIYNKDIKNIQLSIDAIDSEYIKSIYILNEDGFVIAKNNTSSAVFQKYKNFEKLKNLNDTSIKRTDEYIILNTFEILDIPIGYLVVEADLNTYENHISKEIDALVIGALISMFLFLLATIFISNSLSTPIESIIKKLQNTDDDDILELLEQPQEEFKYLSAVISNTHNRLRNSNLNLELQVNKKTQELQELNTGLELKIEEAIKEVENKNKMLQQKSRMAQMGEMISMIAHQWRQPLGAISAVCIDLRMKIKLEDFELDTKEGKEDFLYYVENSLIGIDGFVQNLTHTIDDFRNFHRPDKKLDKASIDKPISKALTIINASLANDNILLKQNYESTFMIDIYSNELMQVVLNILKNSQDNFKISANNENEFSKYISIKTYDDEAHTFIEICDNGGGIPQDIIEKIYDPYFSTKDEKNGTGLGLYMSKTIVNEHHKGELTAQNTKEGVCFRIKLNHTK